jgi:hypothetical protein
LSRQCGSGGSDSGVDNGGESGGEVRAAAKAAENAIATAAAMAVATAMAMAMACDGCVDSLTVAATAAGTTTARDDGQQQHSTPPFCPRLVVKCLFSAGSHSFPTKPSAHSVAQDVLIELIELEHVWAGHRQRYRPWPATSMVSVMCSLSLFLLIYFGRVHELSRDMFIPQSCSSRDT